jgi:hypothetical protein
MTAIYRSVYIQVSAEFMMPVSVDAHGIALTELVEEIGNYPPKPGAEDLAPRFVKVCM